MLPIPTGPAPQFSPGIETVSIDVVYEAYQVGAAFYFLDARPTEAFDEVHIQGAVSIPHDDVERLAPILPKETWYVSYGVLPHSPAEIVRDYLKENGWENVAVLEEGFDEWNARGYPTKSE